MPPSERDRIRHEDAVKHLLHYRQSGQTATIDSLAGAVGLSRRRAWRLVARMEAAGLMHSSGQTLSLTPAGERLALQVVRAHRLWETYLAQEAGMPLARVHGEADAAEHHLSASALQALEDHLGHPQTDPHGDPIPTADGALDRERGASLTDWPLDTPGRIVHIEDEPVVAFRQIAALGLRPGSVVRVLERDARRMLITDGQTESALAPVVAGAVQVTGVPAPSMQAEAARLNDWPLHRPAQVVGLDPALGGISRRRLLDLGVTPGTTVEPVLRGMFGGARAYRVRGTTIAIREGQAREIWVGPVGNAVGARSPQEA